MPRRTDLLGRWSAEMARSGLFRAGERVGVAVSGGPDSVLLFEFLWRLSEQAGLTLSVVHFNHHLRGSESDADEQFVKELAGKAGLEILRAEADVLREAREKRQNLEATARALRYRFFFSLVNQGKLDKVATAHTANDQAETVLLRLLRGTGTRGLGGIYPVLERKVVRPFLNLTRAEVEAELERRKLAYRVDSTNQDLRPLRNKVRIELLPLLQKEFNPRTVTLLKDLADRARDDEMVLEQQARDRAKPWRIREGSEEKIPVRSLIEFLPAIQRRVVRQMLMAVRGHLRGITHAHVEELRRFALEAQSGRTLVLPGGAQARKEFDWLVVRPQQPRAFDPNFSFPVQVPGEVIVPALGRAFVFKFVQPEDLPRAYNENSGVWLDFRKLPGKLVLRNWRAGDRYQPFGRQKVWKLKELFRQKRIPAEERKAWPVLESGAEIVWVRGFPPAAETAAVNSSKQVVAIIERPATVRQPSEVGRPGGLSDA